MSQRTIGSGTAAYDFGSASGVARRFSQPEDVIAAFGSDLEHTFAIVDGGGTTFLSPILGRLAGIICRTGTMRSHLAIVAREFQVPCLLGVDVGPEIEDGTRLVMESTGDEQGLLSVLEGSGDAAVPSS